MAIAAVSLSPVGVGTSVSAYVAKAVAVLEAQDAVRFELGSMFTTLEGPLPAIFAVIEEMQEAIFAAGAERVGAVIKVDERRDREASMEDKLSSLKSQL